MPPGRRGTGPGPSPDGRSFGGHRGRMSASRNCCSGRPRRDIAPARAGSALPRRDGAGLLGGGLLYRAVTGHCHLYEALGWTPPPAQGSRPGPRRTPRRRSLRSPSASPRTSSTASGATRARCRRSWPVRERDARGRRPAPLEGPGAAGPHLRMGLADRRGPARRGHRLARRSRARRCRTRARSASARAPADRGTVVTLRFRFDPPGGALGDAVAQAPGLRAPA